MIDNFEASYFYMAVLFWIVTTIAMAVVFMCIISRELTTPSRIALTTTLTFVQTKLLAIFPFGIIAIDDGQDKMSDLCRYIFLSNENPTVTLALRRPTDPSFMGVWLWIVISCAVACIVAIIQRVAQKRAACATHCAG
jgi:hypothetical protein